MHSILAMILSILDGVLFTEVSKTNGKLKTSHSELKVALKKSKIVE